MNFPSAMMRTRFIKRSHKERKRMSTYVAFQMLPTFVHGFPDVGFLIRVASIAFGTRHGEERGDSELHNDAS